MWGCEVACLTSWILSQEEPYPWVPLAWMVTMVDVQGWGPRLLGGLLLLDDCLLVARHARGSDQWKLEATALAVRARPKPSGMISIL